MTRRRLLVALGLVALAAGVTFLTQVATSSGPFREEEVEFRNGNVILAGTLVIPETGSRHPAVVLVHGSGAEPRREYLRYAREFAAAGIAALAFDKRGAGKSTKTSSRVPYDTLAADVLAAVEMLKHHHAVDSGRIGLWGLSEGEWVAPLAASKMRAPAFLVLLSASALTPSKQVETEVGKLLRKEGYSDSIVALAQTLYGRTAEFQRTGGGRVELNVDLQRVGTEKWFRDARYLDPRLPPYDSVLRLPWFPTWHANMDFDALPLLRAVNAPVLILLGGKDLKNDAAYAATRYAEVLGANPGRQYTIKVFPNAEHAMVEWWLPLHLPPPRYPAGFFELQQEWVRQVASPQRP